ncbi:hypothetical protein GQ44DRAFT_767492 [Phaeosphaeriaceae sp. PMI808]|nr:hypothetical protein GQ44DRAFT_767492 [Phaeosphaeriaceae sp. PMI808]
MDNTTLHTFLFQCPAALRTVVLLGSWDNFASPYYLELDARRGRNYWRGCFTFSNIICDGDLAELSPKRNGLLKMGGTYWYYYKVDGDDEIHNPAEPSTTFCPLLPGQRLNVLELPSEAPSRSHSESPDNFTRNPSDRYLNPVPPVPLKPLSSPHSGASSPNLNVNSMPLPSMWTPKSATYPPPNAFLSPNVVRHARSASASPRMPSTPLFADFRSLKEKLASKRSASRTRSSSKPQELEIGSPVLISTTVEDLNLVPLASHRAALTSAPRETTNVASVVRSIPTIRKEFSPLGSHPVDPLRDPVFTHTKPLTERKTSLKRRRSHVPSTIVTSETQLMQGRMRANSADTRRTRHYLFSNDPWLSSPKFQKPLELDAQNVVKDVSITPELQQPSSLLTPPSEAQRPTSSHGGSPGLQQLPLDKDLPALPRYLTPAPLFACNNSSPGESFTEEILQNEESDDDDDDGQVLSDLIMEYEDIPKSHFSRWSGEIMAYTCSTPDEDVVHSPTFSSLTSICSDSFAEPEFDSKRGSTMTETSITTQEEYESNIDFLSASPPQLDDLRISTFGSDLFNLDIQHADSAPRRQAACFGLGFHYSLPEDETISKTTITQATLHAEPNVQRESSIGQLTRLMDDFGYLGESVL